MKTGYDVFGKAYGVMLRNDLHDRRSIDHQLLRRMVLLEPDSYSLLYGGKPACPDMRGHELYDFAQTFRGCEESVFVRNVLAFTSKIAEGFSLPLEEKWFGGTEQEILTRGTDWCSDMARVAVVLFDCLGMPARLLYLVNPEAAYHGHVITEVFYEGTYGAADPIDGTLFYEKTPLGAFTLLREPGYLKGYRQEYRQLFRAIAVSEYDPMDETNDYSVSKVNDYYRTLLGAVHNGRWIMGEEK